MSLDFYLSGRCGGFIPATWSCPAQFAGDFGGKGGSNRSAGLVFCAARCMLLQCGSERFPRVTAALLGRFLPRLGPLAMRAALFLSLELGQVAYSAAAR